MERRVLLNGPNGRRQQQQCPVQAIPQLHLSIYRLLKISWNPGIATRSLSRIGADARFRRSTVENRSVRWKFHRGRASRYYGWRRGRYGGGGGDRMREECCRSSEIPAVEGGRVAGIVETSPGEGCYGL
ncbi:hypothetical protein TNCV_1614111 [Trichonephila clavipes]|nr:hypothetical protein TNCV_1614111 [Trichonephila clavipes]